MSTSQADANPTPSIPLLPLAVVSVAVLGIEVFLTKLLAYTLPTLVLYVVLGLAMLGFGAAGSLVAARPAWLEPRRLTRALAWSSIALIGSLILGNAVFLRIVSRLNEVYLDMTAGLSMSLIAASLLTLPFVAGGLVVTLSLAASHGRPGRAYAANLVGSGLGCFVPLIVLGPLDGPRTLAFFAGLVWLAAWWYGRRAIAEGGPSTALRTATWASLGLVALSWVAAPHVFPVVPESTGQVTQIGRAVTERGVSMDREFDRWDPTGRIEVYSFDDVPGGPSPYPFLFYAQDASAGSLLVRWDGRTRVDHGVAPDEPAPTGPGTDLPRLCSETLFAQGYFRERPRVLVIGVGGAPDVQCALYHGAREVDAVEINKASIEAVTGPFNELLGGVGTDPRVRYHVRDGRGFAHAARGAGYDLVQMSGVDTKHLLSSSSLALSENYLYTREAFVDYFQSLAPHGVIAALRFGEWEIMRATNTAIAALRDLGIEHPERHVVLIHNGVLFGMLVRREPFPPEELAALRARYEFQSRPFEGARIFFYELFKFPLGKRPTIVYAPDGQATPRYAGYFAQVARGDTETFLEHYQWNIRATTDDRPFFFDMTRYDRPGAWSRLHIRLLLQLLGSVIGLSVLLILAPLLRLRARKGGARPGRALVTGLVYFAAIGLGYLFVEVWLLHAFSMYLGHQTYSLIAVLAALLCATGAGAILGERLFPAPRRRVLVGVGVALAWVALGYTAMPTLLEATWNSHVVLRGAVVVAFVAPLGAALGFPFPGGLAWIARAYPRGVAWCVGVNAFASVIATVVVIPLSLGFGYRAVLLTGLALYAVAALASLTMARDD